MNCSLSNKAASLAALCLLAAFPAILHGADAPFFKPGPKVPEDRPAGAIYPRGREFLFSFYSVAGKTGEELLPEEKLQAELAHYKEAGFSVLGPQYELKDRSLQDAEKHDMQIVYSVGLKIKFTREKVKIDKDEVARQVAEEVRAVADNPRIVAWDLKPEELRPWVKDERAYLEAASKAIREADSLKRPIYHYMPGHANARRIAAIAPWVDLVGKGMYTNYSGMKDSRIWCRWTIEQELKGIEDAEAQAVPLSIPEMFQQPAEEELPFIPAWVRHDVYLSLVSGAKGIIVFSLRQRPDFHAWEAYYSAYQQVGKELLGPAKLGEVFLFGEKRSDLDVAVKKGPTEVEMTFPSGGVKEPIRYPSVAIFNAAYGDARYLFLVNSAKEAVQVEVSGLPSTAKGENLFMQQPFSVSGKLSVELQPLEVHGYRFARP